MYHFHRGRELIKVKSSIKESNMSRTGKYVVNPEERSRQDGQMEVKGLVNSPQQAANSLGSSPNYYGGMLMLFLSLRIDTSCLC